MADNGLKDVFRVLNAYIQEFNCPKLGEDGKPMLDDKGKPIFEENVTIVFPKVLEPGLEKAIKENKIPGTISFVDSKEAIIIRSALGAEYIKKLEYGKGLTEASP